MWKNGMTRKRDRKQYFEEDKEAIKLKYEDFLKLNIDKNENLIYLIIAVTDKYNFIKSGYSEILRLNKNLSINENLIEFNNIKKKKSERLVVRKAKRLLSRKNIKYLMIRDETDYFRPHTTYYLID